MEKSSYIFFEELGFGWAVDKSIIIKIKNSISFRNMFFEDYVSNTDIDSKDVSNHE